MPSARLLAWGAVGGIAGGVLLIIGNALAFLASEGGPVAVTGTWLVLMGFAALILFAIGLHEVLRVRVTGGEALAAVLSIIGSALLVAVSYTALGSAYELVDEPLYLDPTLIGVLVIGSGAFALGMLLFGIAILRGDQPLPRAAGILIVVATVAFLVGYLVTEVSYVGGIILGLTVAWIGVLLNQERSRVDTT